MILEYFIECAIHRISILLKMVNNLGCTKSGCPKNLVIFDKIAIPYFTPIRKFTIVSPVLVSAEKPYGDHAIRFKSAIYNIYFIRKTYFRKLILFETCFTSLMHPQSD